MIYDFMYSWALISLALALILSVRKIRKLEKENFRISISRNTWKHKAEMGECYNSTITRSNRELTEKLKNLNNKHQNHKL